jgi:hypothetical protein
MVQGVRRDDGCLYGCPTAVPALPQSDCGGARRDRPVYATAMTLALAAATLLIGAARPEPGQIAPDFKLPSSTGKQVSLKDLRGRSVVLAFFPKAFTSG